MNIALWVVAIILAVAFLGAGVMHAFRYAQARQQLAWVRDTPKGLVTFSGIAELLGALGLILPAATGILPWLTPVAAVGLAIIMALAALFHLSRHEYANIGINLILLLLAAVVAYGRFALVPF